MPFTKRDDYAKIIGSMRFEFPPKDDDLLARVDALGTASDQELAALLREAILGFSNPNDTDPKLNPPLRTLGDPQGVFRMALRANGFPRQWGDETNPLTRALRAADEGMEAALNAANRLLKERLDATFRPIRTPLPSAPEVEVITNVALMGPAMRLRQLMSGLSRG